MNVRFLIGLVVACSLTVGSVNAAPSKSSPTSSPKPTSGFAGFSQRADATKKDDNSKVALVPNKPVSGFAAFSQKADANKPTASKVDAKPVVKDMPKPDVTKLKSKDDEIAALKAKVERQKVEITRQQAANKAKKDQLLSNRAEMSKLRDQRDRATSQANYQRYRANNAQYAAWEANRRNRVWVDNNPTNWTYRPGYTYHPGYGHYGYGETVYGPVIATAAITGIIAGAGTAAVMNSMYHDHDVATKYASAAPISTVVAPYGTEVVRNSANQYVVLVPQGDTVVEAIVPETSAVSQENGVWTITGSDGASLVISDDQTAFNPAQDDDGAGVMAIEAEKTEPVKNVPAKVESWSIQ